MNKAEFISAIAEKAGITKSDAHKAMNAFMEVTGDTLKNGEGITLLGFGTFSVKGRPSRTVRNPRSGNMIKVPAKRFVRFKAGRTLAGKVS